MRKNCIYSSIYTRYDILLEPEDKIRRMEGVRGKYLLNGDVNNADDSTSDSISRSIARPVSGVSVLPRTIEARIDSVPGGTGKGYKTYRCLVLSDASSVDATKQIAMVRIHIYRCLLENLWRAGCGYGPLLPRFPCIRVRRYRASELIIRVYTSEKREN